MHDRLPEVDDSGVGHKAGEDRHSGPGWEDLHSNGHWLDFSLGDPQEGSDSLGLGRRAVAAHSAQLGDWNDDRSD